MVLKLLDNSQLPGLTLSCGPASDRLYSCRISPDCCRAFRIEILDREAAIDRDRLEQLRVDWSSFRITSQRLAVIRCEFDAFRHPHVQQNSNTVPINEPSAQEVQSTSSLVILFAVPNALPTLVLNHFAQIIEMRAATPNGINGSFPLYRRGYEAQEDNSTLTRLIIKSSEHLKAPPVPVHLHKTQILHSGHIVGGKPLSLTDISIGGVHSRPCITEQHQIIDIFSIGLLRDFEHQVKCGLHPVQAVYARQLRALSLCLSAPVIPSQFHLSRSMIDPPTAGEKFEVDITNILRLRRTNRRGRLIDVNERVTIVDQYQSRILNQGQRSFLKACNTQARYGLLKLVGPARSGKTFALAAVAVSSALLCAGATAVGAKTNLAVEKLVKAVRRHEQSSRIRIVRLHATVEESRLRHQLCEGESISNFADMESCSLAAQTHIFCVAISAEHRWDQVHGDYDDYARAIDSANKAGHRWNTAQERNCWIEAAKKAETRFLHEQADIVVSTMDTLAFAFEVLTFRAETVVLDDAAQLIIPEIVAVLATNGNTKRLVMAGDPNQLSSTPLSVTAEMNEWATIFSGTFYSPENRYIHVQDDQTFYLQESLWNQPLIVEFAKELIGVDTTARSVGQTQYGAKLAQAIKENRASGTHRSALRMFGDWDFEAKPMAFIHIDGIAGNLPCPKPLDWRSSEEASVTFDPRIDGHNPSGDQVIARLVADLITDAGVCPSKIGVLTAYNLDAQKLISMLGHRYQDLKMSTISRLQNDGKEIVIVHTVSFNEYALKRTGNIEQLYTALTRSKGQVFWVGNFNEALRACRYHGKRARHLAKLLDFVLRKRLLVDWNAKSPVLLPAKTGTMLQNVMEGKSNGPSKRQANFGGGGGGGDDQGYGGSTRTKFNNAHDGDGDGEHYEMDY